MSQHRSDRRSRRTLRGVEQQHDDDEPQPDPNGIGERDDDNLQQQAQRKDMNTLNQLANITVISSREQ